MTDPLVALAADYYARKLAEFGATPKGADWNSSDSQALRFVELLRICDPARPLDINDYGCGYGALATFLAEAGQPFDYCGYDAAAEMIAAARQHVGADARCRFTSDRAAVTARAYTVASGIFNVRGQTPDTDWWDYIVRTIDDLAALSTVAFSCNFLTSHSDRERQRDYLYYSDPARVLEHCLSRFPRRVSIRHDYPLYEFTVLVRL
jgi:SAM-dependent methyltransferase